MIKASVILLSAFLLTYVLRRRTAAERHLVWAAAIFAAAIIPILSMVLPSWQPAFANRFASALPTLLTRTDAAGSRSPGVNVAFQAQSIETTSGTLGLVLPFFWLCGSTVCLVFTLKGFTTQRRIRMSFADYGNTRLRSTVTNITALLRCRRTIRLAQGTDDCMPMTWGLFRPHILLPGSSAHWVDERLRAVLAHEIAHVQRMDWFFQMTAQVICSLFWFNPLFWIASNRLHRESELACDDAVLRLGMDARDYATHLLEIARRFRANHRWSPTLAMARPSDLEKRFAALLKAQTNREAIGAWRVLLIMIAALAIVVPLGAIHLSNVSAVSSPAGAFSPTVDQYTSPPLYSDEARSRGVEGQVILEVTVGVEGKARSLQVIKALGFGLDQNALVAVRDWHFVPGGLNGKPVESKVRIPVEFSLKNAELNESIANDMATRIGPGVTPPQVVYRSDPVYPANAARARIEGAVVLDAVIPDDGTPRVVRVIRSLDWQFDESAINALKQWRFSPAMKDGHPVKVRMNVAVEFPPHS